MIPVKKIVITRWEGPVELCNIPHEFTNFEDANAWLRNQSHTFATLGYHKHSCEIEFEDGTEYSCRLDCKHHTKRNNDLDIIARLRSACEWYTGRKTNFIDDEDREQYLRWIAEWSKEDPEINALYIHVLDHCLPEEAVC
jgi:hypothetical protein